MAKKVPPREAAQTAAPAPIEAADPTPAPDAVVAPGDATAPADAPSGESDPVAPAEPPKVAVIDPNLSAVLPLCGEGNTKFVLSCCRLTLKPEGYTVEATDTKVAIVVESPYRFDAADLPEPLARAVGSGGGTTAMLPAKAVGSILEKTKKIRAIARPILKHVAVAINEKDVSLGSTDLENTNLQTVMQPVGRYPDIVKACVPPSGVKPIATVRLDPELLLRLMRAMMEFSENNNERVIDMEVYAEEPYINHKQKRDKKLRPVLFRSRNAAKQTALGVVMPIDITTEASEKFLDTSVED